MSPICLPLLLFSFLFQLTYLGLQFVKFGLFNLFLLSPQTLLSFLRLLQTVSFVISPTQKLEEFSAGPPSPGTTDRREAG